MPDITMCSTKECPLHDICYRFTATPSEFRQSWFAGDPRQVPKLKGREHEECNFYWPIDKKSHKNLFSS